MTILINDYPAYSPAELLLTTAPLVLAFHLEPFVTEYITYKICDNFPKLTMCSTEYLPIFPIIGINNYSDLDSINLCP